MFSSENRYWGVGVKFGELSPFLLNFAPEARKLLVYTLYSSMNLWNYKPQ